MNSIKKKLIFVIVALFASVLLIFSIDLSHLPVNIQYSVWNDHCDTFQVFYTKDGVWRETDSVCVDYYDMGSNALLKFAIPYNDITKLRFDLGNIPGDVSVKNLVIDVAGQSYEIAYSSLINEESHSIEGYELLGNGIRIPSPGDDPYLVYDLTQADAQLLKIVRNMERMVGAIASIFIFLFMGVAYRYSGAAVAVFKKVYTNRKLTWSLAVSDFKAKYAGSQYGVFWAFVQPMLTALIYIFVFQVIGRAAPTENNYPYALWLLPGIVPWFFFSESLMSSTNSLAEYSYLVKKVMFDIEVLPLVKILSSLFVHMFLTCFVLLIYLIAGCSFELSMLQIPYFVLCNFALCAGIGYFTSAILPFFKDMSQLLNVLLMVGMWSCPIMWDLNLVQREFQIFVKLNPMFYIVQGFRDSFMGTERMAEFVPLTVYFWMIVILLVCVGTIVFKRLSKHFADVL